MLPALVEEQDLRAALALVVARARADRVDVAPVALGLRVHEQVTVYVARRGLEDLRIAARGQAGMLISPFTLVLVVCTGSRWQWIGEAAQARL